MSRATAHPCPPEDWGIKVSRLIKFGHSWRDIQDYSYAQIRLFIESAEIIEAESKRHLILQTAIASQGSEKAIKEALAELGG